MFRYISIILVLLISLKVYSQELDQTWLPITESETGVKVYFPDQIEFTTDEFYAFQGAKQIKKFLCKTGKNIELSLSYFNAEMVRQKDAEKLLLQWQDQTGLKYGAKISNKKKSTIDETKIVSIKYQGLLGKYIAADFFYYKGYVFRLLAYEDEKSELSTQFFKSVFLPAIVEDKVSIKIAKEKLKWQTINEFRYTIKFPGEPLNKITQVVNANEAYTLHSKALNGKDGIGYILSYRDYTDKINALVAKEQITAHIASLRKGKLKYTMLINIYKFPCEEYVYKDRFYNYKMRTYIADNRLYQLMIKTNKRRATSWQFENFFNEFLIKE